jgi:PAS domain S-box-containing protein
MLLGIGAYRHVVLLWMLILSFEAYVSFDLWTSRQEVEWQAAQLATSYVRLVEEQASGSFQRTNILLRQASAIIGPAELRAVNRSADGALPDARRRAVEAALADLQRDGHGIVSMSMTDARGRVFASTMGTPPGSTLADRDYFQTLREGSADAPVVSQLVMGRLSGKWGIQVARALRTPDGGFAGMVVANLGLAEYLRPFYESLLLPAGAVVALRDLGHRTVVRYPGTEAALNKPVPTALVDQAFAAGITEGAFRRTSPVDGVPRLGSFRRLSQYPLYAVVGLADSEVMADWWKGFDRAVLFMVLVGAGGVLATAMLRRKELLEREIRINSDKLALALKAAHAGTWYWDPSTGRMEWSAEQTSLYGVSQPARTVAEWLALIHPDDRDRVAEEMQRTIARREVNYRSEFRVLGRDGSERWLAGIGTVVYDRDGRPLNAFGVHIDISAAKVAETQLKVIRDEALEAKGEAERACLARSKFLAAASHDLRQPVQSLLLLIEVLKIRLTDTPMQMVAGQMEQALDTLRLLLNSLLDMSKLDAGVVVPQVQEVDLGRLLGRLAEEYHVRAAHQGLELRLVPTSLCIVTDPTLLERLLRNLLENALRYTAKGRILMGCRRAGGGVRIEVMDTGMGIAPENHEAVFEEFHQVGDGNRDRQGLGLGLAIVRRLVTLLGGRIELRSALGRGARFSMVLPLAG